MKTRNLIITLSVTVLAAVNVMAADALLSPRAADQQIKTAAAPNNDPNLAAIHLSPSSPRATDNQIKTVAGKDDAVTPSLKCARYMNGTPKAISGCADHPGASMPCCSVAGGN